MFERFSEEARQVVVLAQEEARGLWHNYIGTEHLLLGLLREEDRVDDPAKPLSSLGVTLEGARERVVRIVGRGEEESAGQIPFTPRAKKVLELALREALSFGHNWIGPEHILFGIAVENEGVASRILLEFGADPEKIRSAVMPGFKSIPPGGPRQTAGLRYTRPPMDVDWLGSLTEVIWPLGSEIRQELGRSPDLGDLLLAIACARGTVAGQALQEMAVDLDALWGAIERVRRQRSDEGEGIVERLVEVRLQKDEALKTKQFDEAAKLRDEERDLVERARSGPVVSSEVLEEIRRRLGLPAPPKPRAEP